MSFSAYTHAYDVVSILVVVDRALGRNRGLRNASLAACFNPCCRGSGSGMISGASYASPIVVFQSLLSWIGLSDLGYLFSPFRLDGVSILVVVDRALGLPNVIVDAPTGNGVSILVVVDRALGLDEIQECGAAGGRCFNPCCRGSGSRTSGVGTCSPTPPWCFNPCCRGSGSRTLAIEEVGRVGNLVSILVGCRGSGSRTRPRDARQGGHLVVSILVVVDRALGHWASSMTYPNCVMFQSLLSWIGLSDRIEL